MKATTALTLMAAWIWIFQGCDIKSHKAQFAVNSAQNNVNKSACYESNKR